MKNQEFIESFYVNVILPRYSKYVDITDIHWVDHGRIDDSYAIAHYFECQDKEFVLLYESFPGNTYLDDGLSHEVVKCGDERSIELKFSDNKEIDNIIGWFTLYRGKER